MNKQDKGNGKRGIEWTDYTWNPVGGCRHGCRWEMPDGAIALCCFELTYPYVGSDSCTSLACPSPRRRF